MCPQASEHASQRTVAQWTVPRDPPPWEPRLTTGQGGWGWGRAPSGKAFLCLDNTEVSQCPVSPPLSSVSQSPGTLPPPAGLGSGVGLATSRLCDSEQVSTSLGLEFAPERRGLPGRPTLPGGKVHRQWRQYRSCTDGPRSWGRLGGEETTLGPTSSPTAPRFGGLEEALWPGRQDP